MYPEGYATHVSVEGLTGALCGLRRPGHFNGVTTVIAKLFNIVKPTVAYFGQKDAQQAAVIKKMTQDLNMDTEIKVMPIIRERDGLAMSSRNLYLSEEERRDALVLSQSLEKAATLVRSGEIDSRKIVKVVKDLISQKPLVKIDYVSVVDLKDLSEMTTISGEALIALAAFVGKTRLIDNIIIKA